MTNFRSFATAALLGVSALTFTATSASAAPCRNAKGQFAKCTGAAAYASPRKAAAKRVAASTAKPKTVRTAAVAKTAAKSTSVAAHKTVKAAHPTG